MLLRAAPDVDAVFCGSDQIARGVADALRESGRRLPADVALVGYDNWEVIATGCRPPLTTVDMDLTRLGRYAAEQLLAAIDGPAGAPGCTPYPADWWCAIRPARRCCPWRGEPTSRNEDPHGRWAAVDPKVVRDGRQPRGTAASLGLLAKRGPCGLPMPRLPWSRRSR